MSKTNTEIAQTLQVTECAADTDDPSSAPLVAVVSDDGGLAGLLAHSLARTGHDTVSFRGGLASIPDLTSLAAYLAEDLRVAAAVVYARPETARVLFAGLNGRTPLVVFDIGANVWPEPSPGTLVTREMPRTHNMASFVAQAIQKYRQAGD